MTRETNEEKEFSENIDRLLAGQDVEAGEDATEDYSTALQFAQKLKGLRDEPSPAFKDQLRRRLLSNLAEAERQREKRTSFWELSSRLVPRSPVWRSATATVVVAVLAIVVLWGTGILTPATEQAAEKGQLPSMAPAPLVSPPPTPEAPPAEAPEETLDAAGVVELEPVLRGTNVYPFGEEVKIDLMFTNTGAEFVSVAPFPPEIQIIRADTGEIVRSLPQGDEMAEVPAYGTVVNTVVWNQRDNYDQQVEPGRYSIIVSDVALHKAAEPKETWAGFGPAIEFIIQAPSGL